MSYIYYLSCNSFTFVTIYNFPNKRFDENNLDFWNLFFDYCAGFGRTVITGDFNAKSKLWDGNARGNGEGRRIEYACENSNFICLNDPEKITLMSRDSFHRSSIDITFVSADLSIDCGWKTLPYNYGTDHFPEIISTKIQFSNIKKIRGKYKWEKLDWNKLKEFCDEDIEREQDEGNIEYDRLVEILKSNLEKAGARISNSAVVRKKVCIWWDRECQEMVDAKKEAFNNFIKNRSLENLEKYEKLDKETNGKLKKIKKNKYRNFCASLNKNNDIQKTWKVFKRFKNKEISIHNDISKDIDKQIIDRAYDKLAPGNGIDFRDSLHLLNEHIFVRSINGNMLDAEFGKNEYNAAIKSLKKDKSPGPDLFTNSMIQRFPGTIHKTLLKCFNEILGQGIIPDDWTRYNTVFIPKPGNKAVRPISISSNILKVFEKIICKRLDWWA